MRFLAKLYWFIHKLFWRS